MLQLFVLIPAVFTFIQFPFAVGQPAPINRQMSPVHVEKYQRIFETKREPEYTYGDTKAFLYCGITDASKHSFGNVVHWYNNGTQLDGTKRFTMLKNNTLEIDEPRRIDSGVYVARYQFKEKKVLKTHDCYVRYLAKPLILDFPKSESIDEDGTLDLKCSVKGYPRAVVTWFKDNVNLTASKNNSHIRFFEWDDVSNARLVIRKLKPEESGVYKCQAYSGYFKYTVSKQLMVRVNNKLAALWPLLGILASVVILGLAIGSYEANSKKRIKQEEAILYRQSFVDLTAEAAAKG